MRTPVFLSALLLCACGGGGNDSSDALVDSDVPELNAKGFPGDLPESGYFVEYRYTPLGDYYAGYDAILTEDGQIRIRINDDTFGGGTFEFVGQVDMGDPSAWSPGRIISETCGGAGLLVACDGAVTAEISLISAAFGKLKAVIRWPKGSDGDYWYEGLTSEWPTSTYMDVPGTAGAVEGAYREMRADFADVANGGEVVTTVDAAGQLFFQSPATGCTGNGTLAPYLDGSLNVYSVVMLIENCNAEFAHLNTNLEGLATRSTGSEEWGDWLVMWLSSPAGATRDVALTMWGARL